MAQVSSALRGRLGQEGTEALVEMFTASQERHERRLVEVNAELRQEFRDGLAAIRVEIADSRADIIKWNLVMWIGQFAALAGVMSFLLRAR